MQNFAAIDFETANFNRSSVCSIGVVIYKDGVKFDEYYSLIRPTPNYFEQRCIAVHGIKPHHVKNARPFPLVWCEVEPLIKDLPLVAHNMSFDRSCLEHVCGHYFMSVPECEFHCTYRAAKKLLHALPNHRLDTLCSFFGINLNHHNALSDAQACAELAFILL